MSQNDIDTLFWYFRSDNSWPDESHNGWIKYRDIEMQILEEAYQQGKSEVLLDKYRIDLKEMIQFNRADSLKQRPVRRQSGSDREEHQFYTTYFRSSKSTYGNPFAWCPFLAKWLETPMGKKVLLNFSLSIDPCIDGILEEAKKHQSDSESEANWMAEQLRACKTKPRCEVSKICIHLYTRKSFLYHILNTALRDGDYSKVDTLGPICFLIRDYFRTSKGFTGTVYRGVRLSLAEIEMYRKAIGFWHTWPSYSSTSKNRNMADFRGNTLFIIEIVQMNLSTPRAFDISKFSQFPREEEVLLPAGTSFQVTSVQSDVRQRYIINVKI